MNMYYTRSAFTPYARAADSKLLHHRIVAIAVGSVVDGVARCLLFSLTLSQSLTLAVLIAPKYRSNDITSITVRAVSWLTD